MLATEVVMLAKFPLQAFVPVADLDRAAAFYGSTLGLAQRDHVSGVVAVFDAGGTTLRVTLVPAHVPAPWTIAGWTVPDIAAGCARLVDAGVALHRYEGMTGPDGTWTTPGGDRVAWFSDPDGNVLSLTEFARREPTRARSISPVFPVGSVADALVRYQRLGFRTTTFDAGDHPTYGFVQRDGVFLHVALVDDVDAATNASAAYLYVEDADALHAEWCAAGVDGRFHAPNDTDYGLREGAYVDPDGNLLRYGSFVSTPPLDRRRA
jgi:predicted enzyme related to lactoylglutathione lyase